jgi:hypothetical protein
MKIRGDRLIPICPEPDLEARGCPLRLRLQIFSFRLLLHLWSIKDLPVNAQSRLTREMPYEDAGPGQSRTDPRMHDWRLQSRMSVCVLNLGCTKILVR